jgi:transcriptional regulator with XRE-family HTH domain
MTIGNIIKRMRELRGLTQQDLGEHVGFPARNAATRIAQYEMNYRVPKKDMSEKLAVALGISPFALSEPNLETYHSLFQAFVHLEDLYGAEIRIIDGQPMIAFGEKPMDQKSINDFLSKWEKKKLSYNNDETSKDEYDEWRYSYPIMEARLQKASRKERRKIR